MECKRARNMTSLPVRQKTRILKEKKESFRDSLGKEKKKKERKGTRDSRIVRMSTRASENTCWFPNRLLGHYNRSSFIRRERLGSISSLGSLGLPFRGCRWSSRDPRRKRESPWVRVSRVRVPHRGRSIVRPIIRPFASRWPLACARIRVFFNEYSLIFRNIIERISRKIIPGGL